MPVSSAWPRLMGHYVVNDGTAGRNDYRAQDVSMIENVLCSFIRYHVLRGNAKWQNARHVEKKLRTPKKLGKWLANRTRKENEPNLQ